MICPHCLFLFFFFNYTPPPAIYTLSLHDALPISFVGQFTLHVGKAPAHDHRELIDKARLECREAVLGDADQRSEEHTSELQSRPHLVCRLLLEKKKEQQNTHPRHDNRACANTLGV